MVNPTPLFPLVVPSRISKEMLPEKMVTPEPIAAALFGSVPLVGEVSCFTLTSVWTVTSPAIMVFST